jgi:DNA-binding response OmpR family regulator
VLLADDNPDMRLLLVAALRRARFAVTEATDGVDLRDRILEGTDLPDLVITDVRMPRLSGLDAVAAIRQRHASLPVIVITAFGDPETHEIAAGFGACRVIDKPFDPDVLVATARDLVSAR